MRFFKAAVAALAVTGVLAQPAAALEQHSFSAAETRNGHTITMNGFWQVHKKDASKADVAFECYANGAPVAIAIGFRECYLEGADGTRYHAIETDANPAFATATGNLGRGATDQPYRICMSAAASWHTNGFGFASGLYCSPLR